MEQDTTILICKRVKFYSSFDEDAFFEWVNKNKNISSCVGVRDTLEITISKQISEEDLYELFSLFRRYKIRTKPLEELINSENIEKLSWFKNGSHFNMYPAKTSN